ncbi:DUF645 family protein [Vibrio cholerae]|nr:DUF645 family protein [Vibrio cholerae]
MLDVQDGQLGFIKGCIIAEIAFSLSRILNRGQLHLDRFEFGLPTSQLLAFDVCLFNVLA